MVRLTDRLDMTKVVDWHEKPQIKQTKFILFFEMTPSGVSWRVFAEFLSEISRRKKMVCANLREISRSFLRESSRLSIFVRGVNAKKKSFFLGLICII